MWITQNHSLIIIFLAGAFGAVCKDIFQDNKLVLPKITAGEFYLGFLGGVIIGGLVGLSVDGSFLTAMMAGFTGSSVIANLVPQKLQAYTAENNTIENQIRKIAISEGVDPAVAVRVAKCESNLKAEAINTNKDGSRDRGIFQINEKWHPEVTDAQAFDVEFSAKFFCKAYKDGHIDWWNASKQCWNI